LMQRQALRKKPCWRRHWGLGRSRHVQLSDKNPTQYRWHLCRRFSHGQPTCEGICATILG
jgi:hypothetical protein